MAVRDKGDRGALYALAMILFAIVVVFAIGRWTGNPADSHNGKPNEQTAQAEDNKGGVPPEPIYWGLFKPSDTYAQWIAAIAALGSIVVSIWAVWLVRSTLRETQKATQLTGDAVVAATNSNTTAIDALEHERANSKRSLRAYALIDDVNYRDNDSAPGRHIAIYIKNSGQTPAHITHAVCCIGFVNGQTPGRAHAVNGPVGPGNGFIYRAPLEASQFGDGLANIINGTTPIVIYGTFFYEDCFGEAHQTDFRFNQVGALKDGCGLAASYFGNRAT